MNYSGLIKNDLANGEGVCVSFFVQGCPNHCVGCHNPETWDFEGGKPITQETYYEILRAISANGFQRGFSILGGEPFCPENFVDSFGIIHIVRQTYPNIKIFAWTGYYLEDLREMYSDPNRKMLLDKILEDIDVLVDGPFEIDKRDITLHLRGSSNQRILRKGEDF